MTTPPTMGSDFTPLAWQDDALWLLDQTRLPHDEIWLECREPGVVADAILRLAVRGAPAIGVAAAYGLVLGLPSGEATRAVLQEQFDSTAALLGGTRPTAVNLKWALDRGREVFERLLEQGESRPRPALLAWAKELHAADLATNRRMGEHGAALFEPGDRVLTHCNAGGLATAGFGTAVGVIRTAWEKGRLAQAWVDETRPLLQGARLTAWELDRLGIPFHVITDSSAGALMQAGRVDRIVVGADRIAANGDTANKIGTYTVAVVAARHGIPFYIAAPLSTVDLATPTGAEIPIEERSPLEVTQVLDRRLTPVAAQALNLAFDVTPHELIEAIITEVGVLRAPYSESLAAAKASTRETSA